MPNSGTSLTAGCSLRSEGSDVRDIMHWRHRGYTRICRKVAPECKRMLTLRFTKPQIRVRHYK
jgi:hypothetical protein